MTLKGQLRVTSDMVEYNQAVGKKGKAYSTPKDKKIPFKIENFKITSMKNPRKS